MLGIMAAVVVAIAVPQYLAWQRHRHDVEARTNVTLAAAAAESYRADRGTFTGMTPPALVRYDGRLAGTRISIAASARRYCVESKVAGRTWHLAGPAGDVASGSC